VRQHGIATVELGLVLPMLLMLTLGVIDLSRAIQFNNVLISLSREGANLAARTTESPQYILKTLMDTAAPLPMNVDGMMYITKLVGRADGNASVEAQYRPASGGKPSLSSALWACTSWGAGGVCTLPATRPVIALAIALNDGETVYAVESFCDYTLFSRYLFSSDPRLYSITIL
jgi:Flp pilus assembly protein TadG